MRGRLSFVFFSRARGHHYVVIVRFFRYRGSDRIGSLGARGLLRGGRGGMKKANEGGRLRRKKIMKRRLPTP